MRVIAPNNNEIAFKNCLELLKLNPLMSPIYYSTLFLSFESLLVEEDIYRLRSMKEDIENWLCDDYNKITLNEVEIRMYNNMDLNSGFEVNGVMITQLEINQRLSEVKNWLTQKLYQYMGFIRFTAPLNIV